MEPSHAAVVSEPYDTQRAQHAPLPPTLASPKDIPSLAAEPFYPAAGATGEGRRTGAGRFSALLVAVECRGPRAHQWEAWRSRSPPRSNLNLLATVPSPDLCGQSKSRDTMCRYD